MWRTTAFSCFGLTPRWIESSPVPQPEFSSADPSGPAFGNAAEWLRVARTHMKAGEAELAESAVFEACRDPQLTPDVMLRAGRFRLKFSAGSKNADVTARLFAQCTVDAVADALSAAAWREQTALTTEVAPFDSVLPSLEASHSFQDRDGVGVNVFVPWNTRLFAQRDRPIDERIDEELAFWQHTWETAGRLGDARIIQVGYDTAYSGGLGTFLSRRQGERAAIAQLNDRLIAQLPTGAYFVDLPTVAGQVGHQQFYDPRLDHLAKQPFSDPGAVAIAEHVWAGIRATVTGPKKVVVTDLDNTLWGGVVGEVGSDGIALNDDAAGRPFLAYQRYLQSLSERGCILAICSKNNPEDAREPFHINKNMLLRLEDFAAIEAGWDPKPEAIERIAAKLNLGLEHFVFVDDHPAERHAVRAALPQIAVPELPQDPSEYVRAIERGLWFEAVQITGEDSQRASMYRQQNARGESRRRFASTEEYIASLNLTGQVRQIDEENLTRVMQLIGKTNQFNLTTRRHSLPHIQKTLADSRTVAIAVSIQDRYGDYGLVAVVLGVAHEADNECIEIDTWLMSCRVIGRTVEQFTLQSFLKLATDRGYQRVRGTYIPTAKNALVEDLYPTMGLERCLPESDDSATFESSIGSLCPLTVVTETQ